MIPRGQKSVGGGWYGFLRENARAVLGTLSADDDNRIVRTFPAAYVALGANGEVNVVPTIGLCQNCRYWATLGANRASGAVFVDPVLH